jgi:hypothetical protein
MRRKRTDAVAFIALAILTSGLQGQDGPVPDQEPFRTLVPVGAADDAKHGSTVAIGHGLIAVGAPEDEDSTGNDVGVVRVWALAENLPGGSSPFLLELPVQQDGGGQDVPGSNQAPAFGTSIAVSDSLIAVGAPWFDTEDMIDVGAVLVYRRLPNDFEHVATITSDRMVSDAGFGASVQFDESGGLCIGAPWAHAGVVERHVPVESGGWVYEVSFTNTDGVEGDDFGRNLAWFDPRSLLIIAAPGGGDVFLQEISGDAGLPVPPLTSLPVPPGASNYGWSVASDSNRIAVGAPDGASGGMVVLFESVGFAWHLEFVIGAPEGVNDFGIDIALDGQDLLVAGTDFSSDHEVHAFVVESGASVVHALDIRGTASGESRALAVASGVALTGDPDAADSGLAYLTILARDCDANGIPDVDQLAANPELDCNGNEMMDACEILDGSAVDCDGDGIIDDCNSQESDCNANGIDDREEGPDFCVTTPEIPVDIIVISDPSGSSEGKLSALCSQVFGTATDRLSEDFDLRSAWVSVALQSPQGACHDWTMPLGTSVPVCVGGIPRVIDDFDGEEWGDATAVLTRPYAPELLGQFPEWSERDAVLILVTISDEGPQDGGLDGGSDEGCGCDDQSSMWNLIRQAWIENVQVIPMPTSGTPLCVYDPEEPSSFMRVVAEETGGSVLDARDWPMDVTTEALTNALEVAIREAIQQAPRIRKLAADFNDNGIVDVNDLLSLISLYGSLIGDENWSDRHDLDGDGFISVNDLLAVLEVYGENCEGRRSRTITSGSDRRPLSSSAE